MRGEQKIIQLKNEDPESASLKVSGSTAGSFATDRIDGNHSKPINGGPYWRTISAVEASGKVRHNSRERSMACFPVRCSFAQMMGQSRLSRNDEGRISRLLRNCVRNIAGSPRTRSDSMDLNEGRPWP